MIQGKWEAYAAAIRQLREDVAELERIEEEILLPALMRAEEARQAAERARLEIGDHAPTVDELLDAPQEERPPTSRQVPPWRRDRA